MSDEPREPVLSPHPTPPFLRRRLRLFIGIALAVSLMQVVLLVFGLRTRPMWITVAFTITPSIAGCVYTTWLVLSWLRVSRRAQTAGDLLCWECGYSLEGLPGSGNCPECGRTFDVEATRKLWRDYSRRHGDGQPG